MSNQIDENERALMILIMDRVGQADRLHPEGANFLALFSELEEVKKAIKDGDQYAVDYELLDLITVAFRILRGRYTHEVARQMIIKKRERLER